MQEKLKKHREYLTKKVEQNLQNKKGVSLHRMDRLAKLRSMIFDLAEQAINELWDEVAGVNEVRAEENKKSSQAVGATSEDNGKKVKPLFRPLMAVVLSANLITIVYVVNSNQNTKRINDEISEVNENRKQLNIRQEILLKRQEELLDQQGEELERRKEMNIRIWEILNRHQLEDVQ
ncbi:hypothetical protein P9B03_04110 [Metasolibacillus meyeri]|uniref:Uncharacterized protein n=1 Tax=Metasolibacillus meyeri TaxID=1071052 RepID=A0AAW9NPM3_9BACL|nr:hypothetical protein [Metasolibacillus meyeri]MEC1177659.1 hypothetical protein [Metasolibacillus meyeri]